MLECHCSLVAFERQCSPNLPGREFGSVRNASRIVLYEALFQIGRNSGVNLLRMGEGLQDVNVMEMVHR
jgi:hypothetical protein